MSTLNTSHIPPRSGPELLVMRLRAGKKLLGIILSESLWGVWTHWNGARSEPCFCERVHCNGCKRGLPKRWKGYLHLLDQVRKQQIFIELTPAAAESVLCQLGEGVPMRGYRVTFERMNGDQARLKVTVHPSVPDSSSLPPAKDPNSTLMKLWGADRPVASNSQEDDLAPAA